MSRQLNSYIPSKWDKTKVLNKNKIIKRYIPKTALFSKNNVRRYLNRYQVIFIKPDTGSKGIGVIKAQKDSNQKYHLNWNTNHKTFPSYKSMFFKLKKQMSKRKYIVQKGVHLLTKNGKPFDFRVMIQRNKHGDWDDSGIIGRLAKRNKVVTNGAQGASLHTIYKLLAPHLTENDIDGYISYLYHIGKKTSKKLRKAYPDVWEIGMDIGIDNNLKPWIIEVNTRPEYEPLAKLSDKSIYHKLLRNWKHAKRLGYKRYK